MNCSECQDIAEARCECGLVFCEAHASSHLVASGHSLERIRISNEAQENNWDEIRKTVKAIDGIKTKMWIDAANLIKLIENNCKNYAKWLEDIKASYLKRIGESLENLEEYDDIKPPNLEGVIELLYKVYYNKEVVLDSVENTIKSFSDDGLFIKGHTDIVYAVAVTIDDSFMVTGCGNWAVRIWNLKIMRQEAVIKAHSDFVSTLALIANNEFIVSGSADNTVMILNFEMRCEETVLNGHTDEVTSIALTSDDHFIVYGSRDMTVRIWELKARRQYAVLRRHSSAPYVLKLGLEICSVTLILLSV